MPKISELLPATTLAGTEVLPVVQDGETVKTSVAEIKTHTFAEFGANTFPARSSTGALEDKPISDFALALVDDADAAAMRTTLGGTTVGQGLFTAANPGAIRWARVNADNSITLTDAATVRTDIGAQATDATLTALAGVNWAANSLAIGSGTDTVAQVTFAANTFPARSSSGNLVAKPITDAALSVLDDTTTGAMLTTLGAQPLDATLTALAGQNWAANAIPLGSGADTMSQLTLSANTIPGRSSAGNVVAKTVSDTAFTAISQAMYGVYTPTVTNGTNMAANTPREHTWMRVGNTVTVSGFVDADPTAGAATATDFGVALPVASDFANVWECAGGGFSGEAPYTPAAVFADTTNNRATVVFYANTTAVRTVGYSFTYQVK